MVPSSGSTIQVSRSSPEGPERVSELSSARKWASGVWASRIERASSSDARSVSETRSPGAFSSYPRFGCLHASSRRLPHSRAASSAKVTRSRGRWTPDCCCCPDCSILNNVAHPPLPGYLAGHGNRERTAGRGSHYLGAERNGNTSRFIRSGTYSSLPPL